MTTQAKDVDELEALLADLLDDGPITVTPVDPEPEVKPRGQVTKAPTKAAAAKAAAALDAELDGLDDLDLPFDTDAATGLDADLAPTAVARAAEVVETKSLDELDAALADFDEPAILAAGALADAGLLKPITAEQMKDFVEQANGPSKASQLSPAAKAEILAKLEEPAPASQPLPTQDEVLAALEALGQPGLGVPMDELTPEQQKRVTDAQAALAKPEGDDVDALLADLDKSGKSPTPTQQAQIEEEVAIRADAAALDAALLSGAPVLAPSPAASIELSFNAKGPLKTFIDPDALQRDLHFTENSISTAMIRQAALFAHYSTLSAQAKFQYDRCKQSVELYQANLDQQLRDDLTTAGTKFTEKVIEAMVLKDSGYQAAITRMHEAKAIASMVDTAADSFRHKKDMLIQVGADLRQQKQGELVMLEKTKAHPGAAALEAMGGKKS